MYYCQQCNRKAYYIRPGRGGGRRNSHRLGGDIQHDLCQRCFSRAMEAGNVIRAEERIADRELTPIPMARSLPAIMPTEPAGPAGPAGLMVAA